ncbi:hypothetical protein F4823DRAFT_618153 [Ustulina deusta]|nr:hypothetical protein F4823DRAFT_618153 [Ustulina deusta]
MISLKATPSRSLRLGCLRLGLLATGITHSPYSCGTSEFRCLITYMFFVRAPPPPHPICMAKERGPAQLNPYPSKHMHFPVLIALPMLASN